MNKKTENQKCKALHCLTMISKGVSAYCSEHSALNKQLKKTAKLTKPPKRGKDGSTMEKAFYQLGALDKNGGAWRNRILVATPCTGLVRMEWVMARYGQIIPTNWSQVDVVQWMSSYAPMQYLLPDAENLIAKAVIEGDFEWFLSVEEDNVIPRDAFVRLNEYMTKGDIPIVSGLYFTKSFPPEPILYRGRGVGSFRDFKMGDKVWVDGIPFGFTLIHGSIIKALWDESEEYTVNGQVTRRVFDVAAKHFGDPDSGAFATTRGTSDLAWCTRLMKEKIFDKAGWPEFQKKKNPFLVDTNLFVKHIDQNGRQYPFPTVPPQYLPEVKKDYGRKK